MLSIIVCNWSNISCFEIDIKYVTRLYEADKFSQQTLASYNSFHKAYRPTLAYHDTLVS